MSLTQLTAEQRHRLTDDGGDDWFRSLGFAEAYSFPPAERVCFVCDRDGRVVEACFYREVRRWKLFLEIQVEGRVFLDSSAVQRLVATRKPAAIHFPWLRASEIPSRRAPGLTYIVQPSGEDFCIDLPASEERYLRSLGAKTRKHLPYYVRRMEKKWGHDVVCMPLVGQQINRELYAQLLDLNRRRMQRHGKNSAWCPEVVEQRWPIVRESGLLYGVYCRGKLVAGTLSFLHSRDAYLIVLAHDPEFDRLNLGNVVLWLTVKHLIGLRLRCLHLMWGASFYKAQFGGESQPLFRVTSFASPIHAALWRSGIPAFFVLARKVFKRAQTQLRQIGESVAGA